VKSSLSVKNFGVSQTVDRETTSDGYDAASQLTSEVRPGYSASYTFDGNGNRLSKTVNGVTEFYSYDDGDKLLSAGGRLTLTTLRDGRLR